MLEIVLLIYHQQRSTLAQYNKMKKKLYFIGILLLQSSALFAQIFNDGVKVFMDENSLLYVKGGYHHKAGEILNNGQMLLEDNGQWDNNSSNKVFNQSSTGTVIFNVNQLGFVGNTTAFPHLIFRGNGNYLLRAKVEARLSLNLEDSELQVFIPEGLSLLNTNSQSLIRNKGFVNTTLGADGSFLRSMRANEEYLFPVGTGNLMRFVTVKPKDVNENTIAASFIDKDPNTAGYSRLSKSKSVTEINDSYYHLLKRVGGTSGVDVAFHIPSSERFTSLATWVKNTQWDKVLSTNNQNNVALAPGLTKSLVHKNADLPLGGNVAFALAQVTNAGSLELYNAFSPDGDGKNDTWEVKNIDLFPDNDLKIFDRSGNLVFSAKGYNSSKFWDGQNATSGTYVYILRVKIDGKDEYFKGSITMVKN